MEQKESRRPLCPSCGVAMEIARVVQREYGRYQLTTYECQACGVSYIERRLQETDFNNRDGD